MIPVCLFCYIWPPLGVAWPFSTVLASAIVTYSLSPFNPFLGHRELNFEKSICSILGLGVPGLGQ
jgi:hypothetical protein